MIKKLWFPGPKCAKNYENHSWWDPKKGMLWATIFIQMAWKHEGALALLRDECENSNEGILKHADKIYQDNCKEAPTLPNLALKKV